MAISHRANVVTVSTKTPQVHFFIELFNDSRFMWGDRRGSNPRHSAPQADALPTELRPPVKVILTIQSIFLYLNLDN